MNAEILKHLYNIDNMVGDPSKQTLNEIIHAHTVDRMTALGGGDYLKIRQEVEELVMELVGERRLADLASLAMGQKPTRKMNRHERRKYAKLERKKYSTRNKS